MEAGKFVFHRPPPPKYLGAYAPYFHELASKYLGPRDKNLGCTAHGVGANWMSERGAAYEMQQFFFSKTIPMVPGMGAYLL